MRRTAIPWEVSHAARALITAAQIAAANFLLHKAAEHVNGLAFDEDTLEAIDRDWRSLSENWDAEHGYRERPWRVRRDEMPPVS